jgi:predicted nucleic acid-binding protein
VHRNPLYLLDSSVILHLVRGRALGERIEQEYGLDIAVLRPLVAIVSHGELWVIAERKNWGENKRAVLRNTLDQLTTADLYDPSIIESYVAVDRVLRQHPDGARSVSDNDVWIAAVALAYGATMANHGQRFLASQSGHLRGGIH